MPYEESLEIYLMILVYWNRSVFNKKYYFKQFSLV